MQNHNPPYQYRCVIDRVVDGDTVDVWVDLGFKLKSCQRIRLEGIDTPELRSSDPDERVRAKAAKVRVEELCPVGSTVWVYTEKTGKYGRYIGRVYLEATDTLSLNERLVDEGHAKLMG